MFPPVVGPDMCSGGGGVWGAHRVDDIATATLELLATQERLDTARTIFILWTSLYIGALWEGGNPSLEDRAGIHAPGSARGTDGGEYRIYDPPLQSLLRCSIHAVLGRDRTCHCNRTPPPLHH